MSTIWCVLHCKPNKEEFVHRELESRGVAHFYPFVTVVPVNPRSRKRRPYFPGYIFVHIDLDNETQASALRWVPGTVGLDPCDGLVAGVPERLVNALQKRMAELPAIMAAERTFRPGDRVRVVSGPFAGYEGIFDMNLSGQERVQVLLRYLHHNIRKVDINTASLVKVTAAGTTS